MSRASLISLILFLLVESLFGLATYFSFSSEVGYHLKVRETQLNTAVESIASSYARLVEAIYQQDLNIAKVIERVALADQALTGERSKLRGRLYRQLYPTYRLLQERDIRVLQLVLKDGTSLLRMHRPDLYGDDIAKARPVLKQVLETQTYAQGFENGRVYPGFRYAFPLKQNGALVGVADFSVAFDAFYSVLSSKTVGEGAFSQFLLRRDLVEAVAHPSVHSLFRPTPVHVSFVIEDEGSSLRDINTQMEAPAYRQVLDRSLGDDARIHQAMAEGETFSLYKCMNYLDCYQVVLLSVKDSLGRVAAYIVGTYPDQDYMQILRDHLLLFVVGSVLLFVLGRSYRRWLSSRQRLQTIADNMVEGLYVMSPQGNILFSNSAAERVLGYSEEELMGQNGHDLFHFHSADIPLDALGCPIRSFPLAGKVYRSGKETFRCKNEQLIRVEVTSSPLHEEGDIAGVVVLFRDITLDYENQVRLQQTEAAFENMAEGVMVTDAEVRILAVNRAFTEITGYSEEDVLGQSPKLLASGIHTTEFYQSLWEALNNKGYWEGEIYNRRKDGEPYPEWINITAINNEQGELVSYVSVFSDITEKRKKEQRLQDLAYNDQLTGLPNRTSFMRLFEHALQHAQRRDFKVALLFLDLDHFKQINDTLGHLVGDKLLTEVGGRLRHSIRQDDVVARVGGDEFILMLESFDQDDDAARVANKLIQCLMEPFTVDGRSLHIAASIGISLFPDDGMDATTLLKHADAAMYRSKRKGRGCYSYFTEDMALEAQEHFTIETDLRRALSNQDQLVIYYQPKIRVADQSLVGAEALIRWQHPERGLVSPMDFLPVAHEANLMNQITGFVLQQVARQIRSWNELDIDPGRISINLDNQTIGSHDLVHYLLKVVRDEGIVPEQVELEITETMILQPGQTLELYSDLVSAGFTLSIDDFGTGESSLFRLKHLPVQTLKIDRAFIKDVEGEGSDLDILRTIVEMARSLGKNVLCEGVETAVQYELLKGIGCDEIQGFYFARPMPAEQMTRFLCDYDPNCPRNSNVPQQNTAE